MLVFHYRPVCRFVITTWADGTDEEIATMIKFANEGDISLDDYWSVGDERMTHLSTINSGGGLTIAQPGQTVVLVLMDTGKNSGYKDFKDKAVNFIWGQKDCLSQKGRMNTSATNLYSWNGCAMRTDLNNTYYNALPAKFRACLKQFKTITIKHYSGSSNQTSLDYIALFAEKEMCGSIIYSNSTEANALTQIEYYKTTANRIKKYNGADYSYWERSPASGNTSHFCYINTDGSSYSQSADTLFGVAPFGCI